MIRSIVFDFDGVLVESVDVKTRAFASLFECESEEIVQMVVKHHLENGGISRYEKFRYYYKYFLKRPLSQEEETTLGERFSEMVVKSVIEAPWVPGAKETLEYFYGKIQMFVASGTPESELSQIIKARNMEHYFSDIYGAPQQKASMLRKIVSLSEGTHKAVIMIGDSMSDYLAAKETGVQFIGRADLADNPFHDKSIKVVPDLRNFKEIVNFNH